GIAASGFGESDTCGGSLAAGAECSIALTGSGPGSVRVSAANAGAQTRAIPAPGAGAAALPVVFSPKELDFGVVTAGSPVVRTIAVSNLTATTQTFRSAWSVNARATPPYTVAEQTTDCTPAGSGMRVLAPGGTCRISISLSASAAAADDGVIRATWLIGGRGVALTAYGQAGGLSVSATEIAFGTQYKNGLRLPRYLYVSNQGTGSSSHARVALPAGSPFTVSDECPSVLEPHTVCRMTLGYAATHTPAVDSVTLTLDGGLSVLVTGRTLDQPGAAAAAANPNLSVSPGTAAFATPVPVTGGSSTPATITVKNTGAAAFALSLAVTGDFAETTSCGSTVAAGGSCSVSVTFAPSAPGTRNGLLSATAGAGTGPLYVTLSGTGTEILSPATNGSIDLGSVPPGQPTVRWFKVTQPFTAFSATSASANGGVPFRVALVEDIGYGHGEPPVSAFGTAAQGTCFDCWLGVLFEPAATGANAGTLSLSSGGGGNPYVFALSGVGSAVSGLLLTPASQDFGPVPVNSTSAPALFTLTNLTAGQSAVTLSAPAVTGDFAVSSAPSGGAPCGGSLGYGASCFVEVGFAPTATGTRTGTLLLQAGGATVSSPLSGYGGQDPGVALSPVALVYGNVPGASSTQQSVAVTNTGSAPLQVGTPVAATTGTGTAGAAANSFQAASNCGLLNPGGACTVLVTFTPGSAQAAGTLTIPVTAGAGGSAVLTEYTVPLTGAYTNASAGLQILPAQVQFGPSATGSQAAARELTINNLSGRALSLEVSLPRQFVLVGRPCAGLAPGASCTFSVAFLPLTNGTITGTIFAAGTPTDGSATVNGTGYLEGYGTGTGALSVTGGLQPGGVLDFGQVPSGQTSLRVLTVSNVSTTAAVTVRRITVQPPFTATSTCGGTLAPGASCTVALSYAPVNQVAPGVSAAPSRTDTGSLEIESDAATSPDRVNLTGTVTLATASTPSGVTLAAFTASQNSFTFGATRAGDVSAAQQATLNNTGSGVVHILGIGSTPDFTVTSDCTTLLPGASCTATVSFTPQPVAQGGASTTTRAGAVEIASDATTPLEFLSVVGVGTPSGLTLSQTALDFGPVAVGGRSALNLPVTNAGSVGVTFGTLTATGDYSVSAGTCPLPGAVLAPATSCTLQVVFAPSSAGVKSGTLSIASTASTLPLTVALSGSGVQSHLQISPGNLDFGPIAVGSSANLSLTLANTGTAPITGLTLSATRGYNVSGPCALSTLAPGVSCSVTVTFTPTAVGSDAGTLTVVSSDANSPGSVQLAGSGISSGGFSLTVDGTGTASVRSGQPASFGLTLTGLNGFTGQVVLNCTPIAPADFASCSLLPSQMTLNSAPQHASATLNTVTSVATARAQPGRSFGETALGLLCPALLFSWKARTSSRRLWRRAMPFAWAVFASIALLTSSGCGGSGADPNLRYATPGTYQYQVTASSVGAAVQLTQTVTLNLTITR
ncbi:MAG: choice-of-anchor D domain-containing protein, partial [Acidobacteriota bacterium]|nr:choice-of-anchor D domain-containing protein [Acidobacteriota bacterium]